MNPINSKKSSNSKNSRKQILWITQTAMLLAVAVISQIYLTSILSFNPLASQLAVGSIVNLCLVLSTLTCGFFSGFSISVCASFIPLMLGRIVYPQQAFIVALGNTAIVFVFWLVCRKKVSGENSNGFSRYIQFTRWGTAAIMGALAKFMVLWLGMTKIFINLVLMNDKSLAAPQIEKMTAAIMLNFSWMQIITALTGSALAYIVYRVLKNVLLEKPVQKQSKTIG